MLNHSAHSNLQRAAAELQMKLGHSSAIHDDRNVLALKAAVLEMGRLIDQLSEFPGTASMKTKERIKPMAIYTHSGTRLSLQESHE